MCPVHMGVDPESTKAPKPVPGNQWYKLRLKELKCKKSKSGKGFNYEAYIHVVDNKAEFNDSFVLFRMNNGFSQGFAVIDFCHGLGMHIETDGTFPGGNKAWEFDPKEPENPEKARYKGPLLGRTLEAELIVSEWDKVERNEVKQIRCIVPQCGVKHPDIKHRTNLIGKK